MQDHLLFLLYTDPYHAPVFSPYYFDNITYHILASPFYAHGDIPSDTLFDTPVFLLYDL